MKQFGLLSFILFCLIWSIPAQSGRTKNYSESSTKSEVRTIETTESSHAGSPLQINSDTDVIRVETDLVTIPVRLKANDGKPVADVRREEFKIFENGIEQEIAYFSNEEQPFTVALVVDMSYSSVFKLKDIQSAAFAFVSQLRQNDRVMIVSFDEKARVLCEPTNDRKVLRLAIEGSKIASGTSLYTALDLVLNEKFNKIPGRKAVVLLSDGVDTSSKKITARDISRDVSGTDVLIYPIHYNTYDDVQKSRRKNAEIRYDDDDRPYVVDAMPVKGERDEDYETAREFLKDIADQSGGRLYRVTSTTNLDNSFANIANELRKIYSLGYYPIDTRKKGAKYAIKVRVYRPNLNVHARGSYSNSERDVKP